MPLPVITGDTVQVTRSQFDPTLIKGPANLSLHLPSRSDTLHLSQIYHDIEETLAPREPMGEEQLNTYRSAGFLWEHAFNYAFQESLCTDKLVRPAEFQRDGISGSPDLIQIEDWAVWDTKCTWKSSRKLEQLEKFFWSWLVQLKGYCYMVGTQKATLIVFCVNGDYKPPMPQVHRLDLMFSQHEITENWRMVTTHARKRGWL